MLAGATCCEPPPCAVAAACAALNLSRDWGCEKWLFWLAGRKGALLGRPQREAQRPITADRCSTAVPAAPWSRRRLLAHLHLWWVQMSHLTLGLPVVRVAEVEDACPLPSQRCAGARPSVHWGGGKGPSRRRLCKRHWHRRQTRATKLVVLYDELVLAQTDRADGWRGADAAGGRRAKVEQRHHPSTFLLLAAFALAPPLHSVDGRMLGSQRTYAEKPQYM
jgi:hypothetical protein